MWGSNVVFPNWKLSVFLTPAACIQISACYSPDQLRMCAFCLWCLNKSADPHISDVAEFVGCNSHLSDRRAKPQGWSGDVGVDILFGGRWWRRVRCFLSVMFYLQNVQREDQQNIHTAGRQLPGAQGFLHSLGFAQPHAGAQRSLIPGQEQSDAFRGLSALPITAAPCAWEPWSPLSRAVPSQQLPSVWNFLPKDTASNNDKSTASLLKSHFC